MDLNISLASGVEGICHLIPNFQFLAACCQNPTDEYIYIMNILQLVSELFSGFMPCNSMVLDGSCDGSAMCLTDWRNIC